MTEIPLIRCIDCRHEFTETEIDGATACPKCGSHTPPETCTEDIMLPINWRELMILANWASFYCEQALDDGAQRTLRGMVERISKYRPENAAALTLKLEISEMQERGFHAELVDDKGQVLVGKPTLH